MYLIVIFLILITRIPQVAIEPPSTSLIMTRLFLDIDLVNRTEASMLYAHITGIKLDAGGNSLGPMVMDTYGEPYMLQSPALDGQALGVDHGIPIGKPGTKKRVRIPRLAGGRIYFSKNRKLTFLVNKGPALVEPSTLNKSDPNYGGHWTFAEFTFNQNEVFANVSYVDFLSIPTALRLETDAGVVKQVKGIPKGGVTKVAKGLEKLGSPWNKLVVRSSSKSIIRILSMNSGYELYPELFGNYFNGYINEVWKHYETHKLYVDTQNGWGVFTGQVEDGLLRFIGRFKFYLEKPTTQDVLTCNTGPFAVKVAPPDEQEMARLAVGARVAAAFNRVTLLKNNRQPVGEKTSTYYGVQPCNYYSKKVHRVSHLHRGYTFPYDDVSPDEEHNLSGSVNDPNPKVLTVIVGGFRK
ncbi:hypothetical protein EDB81DRAFT_809892 [Dactylonectria macrodidyma]|uniref:GH64 domain-containing protein n=1 Tax=Dactylonectria macrodidyma TaxID=307937 RepID=A0A9P9DZ21_9HYPO|nr:hypothetical protein EDB81DRAFT_809892 [Dactylonectria macrodidyma]